MKKEMNQFFIQSLFAGLNKNNENSVKSIVSYSKSIFIAGCIFFTLIGTACATEYFVSTSGNNGNIGLSMDQAWGDVKFGSDQLHAGDTLYIDGGTYYDDEISIPRSGTSNDWITIKNYNDEYVLLQHEKKFNNDKGINVLSRKSYIKIENIHFSHYGTVGFISGKYEGNTHHLILENTDSYKSYSRAYACNRGAHDIYFGNISISDVHHPTSAPNAFDFLTSPHDRDYNPHSDYMIYNITCYNVDIDDVHNHNGFNFGQGTSTVDGKWTSHWETQLCNNFHFDGCDVKNAAGVGYYTNKYVLYNSIIENCVIDNCFNNLGLTGNNLIISNVTSHGATNNALYILWDTKSYDVVIEDFYGYDCGKNCPYTKDVVRLTTRNVNCDGTIPDQIPDPTPEPTTPKEKYDNRLREESPNSVLSDTTWIDVGKIEEDNYNSIIWFNLSQFNSTDVIEKATLSLLWYYESREQSTDVEIYQPNSWDTNYVTWNSCTKGVAWINQGGDWFDKNFAAQGTEPYDSITFSADTAPDNKYHDFDVTELVQDYIDGTFENTGFLIKTDEVNDGYIGFYSFDHSNVDQHPKLTIELSSQGKPGNRAPDLDPINARSVDIDSTLELTITATDFDGDTLTYSASGLPTGASFDPATHTFSWTPDESQVGSYQVHFEVSDGDLTDSEDITITVNSVEKYLVLSGMDNRLREQSPNTVLDKTTWIDVGKIGENDFNGVLSFNLSQFNSTDCIEKATLSLLWYYESNEQSTDIGIYRPDSWNPNYVTWNSCTNSKAWNNQGGDWFDKNNAAQGSVPYDSVLFSIDTAPDNQYHDFDVTELVQSYVDGTYENTGFFIKAVEANDGYIAFYSADHPNVDQQPKLTIVHSSQEKPENRAPVLSVIGDKSVNTLSSLEFTPSATDQDDDALTYSVTGMPGGASFDPATQTFSWTPEKGQEGLYQIHFEVTDGSLVDAEDVTITVVKTYPAYDVNEDGVVDILDMTLVVEKYGTTTTKPYPRYDVNTDGTIDMMDMDIIASHYGEITK